jgi:hypothetical protein
LLPDIRNLVREVSQFIDGATWGAYHEMLRFVNFLIDTEDLGLKVELKIEDNIKRNLKFFCVSDWAGDSDTKTSVTGFIIYLLDVPICWHS